MRKANIIVAVLLLSIINSSLILGQMDDKLAAYNESPSRFRGVIEKFGEDYGILNRFYSAQTSPNRSARFKQLYSDELDLINRVSFDELNHNEQIDYFLFKNYLEHEQKELGRFDAQLAEMASLIPFTRTISDLEDTRRTLKDLDSAKAAVVLNDLVKQIAATQKTFDDKATPKPKRTVANRVARTVDDLRRTLKNWYTFLQRL